LITCSTTFILGWLTVDKNLLLGKNLKKIFLLVIAGLLLNMVSCNSKVNDDPRTVLSSFLTAVASKNFNQAKHYTTPDSEGMMDMAAVSMSKKPDSLQQADYGIKNLDIGQPVLNGSYATIAVKNKNGGDSIYFSLRKEGAEWRVSLNISALYQLSGYRETGNPVGIANDSLANLNKASVRDTGSISREKMNDAHKEMDSINTLLKKNH
jgi:hypothetical protein